MTLGATVPGPLLDAVVSQAPAPPHRRQREPEAFLARLRGLDDLLAEHGFPRISPWWWTQLERFFRSGKRILVVRKGRRVGASTIVAPRLAVAEMLWGEHVHTPGTPPLVYAFLSIKRDEAGKRLRGVKSILDVLGEAYVERGDTVELTNRPAVFAVVTTNFRTNVGDTVAFAWCDEVARWRDDDAGANPAEQVVGSLKPALATLPNAKLYLVSSPLGADDYHARQFDLGETDAQCVAFGTTWDINPTLTEADCRALEPDQKLFLREYAAIPSASASPAFERDLVLRCFRRLPPNTHRYPAVALLDSAAGKSAKSDGMAWGTCCFALPPLPDPYVWTRVPRMSSTRINGVDHVATDPNDLIPGYARDERGNLVANPEAKKPRVPCLTLLHVDVATGVFRGELESGALWDRIGQSFRVSGAHVCYGDQYGAAYASFALRRYGVAYRETTYTNADKLRAVYRLRQLMADDALVLPPHAERLRDELLAYTERVSANGTVTYSARGAGKDDTVALLLNAAMAEEQYGLVGSLRGMNHRIERQMAV